jgi:hypothetical protein
MKQRRSYTLQEGQLVHTKMTGVSLILKGHASHAINWIR